MRLLDLFSGIGGFSLAAQWVWGDELEIVAFCEIDKFCQKVLRKHWPNVPIIEDVRDVTLEYTRLLGQKKYEEQTTGIEQPSKAMAFSTSGESWEQTKSKGREDSCRRSKEIDLLTGGFPCQPFSVAGKRKGKEDNRFLWPEIFRVIQEIRPRWVVAENVAGIVRMALDDCLSDLESEDYSCQAIIIPACAVNAPHRRDRVWIVGNSNGSGLLKRLSESESLGCRMEAKIKRGGQDVADSNGEGLQGRMQCVGSQSEWFTWKGDKPNPQIWESDTGIRRVAHGVPSRVDRLKSLGNAIVPQVVYEIFRVIKIIEEDRKD